MKSFENSTFEELMTLKEQRSQALLEEMKTATPERKEELFRKYCPFASYVRDNRDKVKITWSK